MTELSSQEILNRLFSAIVHEAQRNEAFARKLLEAIQGDAVAAQPPEKPKTTHRKAFDVSALHAINILRTHGENVLRGKLEQVKASDDLRAVARYSGLLLTGPAAKSKASRGEVIDGIVAAAKHYDAQRSTASA